jgi:zinc D-Ala-D-Ala carboxypeptidase
MKLTNNFSLQELTSSETAVRRGINNTPSPEVILNLKALCENVLQPLRDWYGKPITITSGYRSPELNKAIKGAKNSDHMRGQAVDFVLPKEDYARVFDWLRKNVIFDQIIDEFGFSWIHISFNTKSNRKQALKAVKQNGKTTYINA